MRRFPGKQLPHRLPRLSLIAAHWYTHQRHTGCEPLVLVAMSSIYQRVGNSLQHVSSA